MWIVNCILLIVGTVAAVMYEDASHARAEIRVNGQSRLCELSR